MAHFARIHDGIVCQVIVIANEAVDGGTFPQSEPLGQAFIDSLGLEGHWLQCSYNGSFRGAYPGQGWTYDPTLDQFQPPEKGSNVDEP